MPISDWKSEDAEFLKQFYSGGQDWTWEGIESKQTSALCHVADWLANLPVPGRHPIALPVRKEGRSSWVAIAFSEGQCEELRELLNAFVGPICSSFSGSRTKIDPENKRHQITAAWAGGARFFDFEALPSNQEQINRLRKSLADMLGVLKRRPALNSGIIRTTEGLLREFRAALVNQDQVGAEKWIQKIRDTGRLSAENLRFLKIEFYAAFGMWRDMCLGSEWTLILKGRRPKRTTSLMIEALWQNYFQKSLAEGLVESAMDQMRKRVLPDSRPLFRSTRIELNPACALTFLLAAACDSPPRNEQAKMLLDKIPEGSEELKFAKLVFAKMTPPEKSEPNRDASDAFALISSYLQRDEYDRAWDLLLDAEPGVTRSRLMLQCVYEFQSLESAQIVSETVCLLNDSERSKLFSNRISKAYWDEIQSLAKDNSGAQSWEEWLDAVESGESPSSASQIARAAIGNWNLEDYRVPSERIRSLGLQIEKVANSVGNLALRDSAPYITEFFLPDSSPQPHFLPIYLGILNAIAFSDQISGQDWTMIETLATAILETGPTQKQYSDMVDALIVVWEMRAEVNRLGWVMDQLDSLIAGPNLDEGARSKLFNEIWKSCSRFARRIDPDIRHYFGILCDDLNSRAEFEAIGWSYEETSNSSDKTNQEQLISERLNGRSIGIYTLNESAAVRAANLIEGICSNVKVRLSHDHGGSDKLKGIARDSDYLIVVTQSAKHAATDFIKAQRPKNANELIYPSGRGAASIVSALKHAIASESG
ncbi:MAG: hypothetical protein RL240_4175 [Planctomycetota bacterium]|jgi:hypothetical protein